MYCGLDFVQGEDSLPLAFPSIDSDSFLPSSLSLATEVVGRDRAPATSVVSHPFLPSLHRFISPAIFTDVVPDLFFSSILQDYLPSEQR